MDIHSSKVRQLIVLSHSDDRYRKSIKALYKLIVVLDVSNQ